MVPRWRALLLAAVPGWWFAGCLTEIGDVEPSGAAGDAALDVSSGGTAGNGGSGGTSGSTADGSADDANDGAPADADAGLDPAAEYAGAVLADQPVGYWRFEESSPQVPAKDWSGAGQHGTYLNGALPSVEGIFADTKALHAPTGHNFVEVGDVFDFAPDQSFSLEAWVKLAPLPMEDSGASIYRRVLSKEISGGAARTGYSLLVNYDTLAVNASRWNAGVSVCAISAPSVTYGAWTHLVLTYDADAAQLRLFTNGLANTTSCSGAMDGNANPFRISAASDSANGIAGAVDEVAVYDHALAPARAQAHFALGAP
jgi:hypothetical protein